MTIHVMLDLETWGTEPGSDLRSIGAVVFDPISGMTASPDFVPEDIFYRAFDNPIIGQYAQLDLDPHWDQTRKGLAKYPLARDPRTVQWWSEQSDEAQAAFANPVDLRDGLIAFGDWLTTVASVAADAQINYVCDGYRAPDNVRLWAHGSHFDPPILAAAYKAVGLPVAVALSSAARYADDFRTLPESMIIPRGSMRTPARLAFRTTRLTMQFAKRGRFVQRRSIFDRRATPWLNGTAVRMPNPGTLTRPQRIAMTRLQQMPGGRAIMRQGTAEALIRRGLVAHDHDRRRPIVGLWVRLTSAGKSWPDEKQPGQV